jgi:hypothetical protein
MTPLTPRQADAGDTKTRGWGSLQPRGNQRVTRMVSPRTLTCIEQHDDSTNIPIPSYSETQLFALHARFLRGLDNGLFLALALKNFLFHVSSNWLPFSLPLTAQPLTFQAYLPAPLTNHHRAVRLFASHHFVQMTGGKSSSTCIRLRPLSSVSAQHADLPDPTAAASAL